MDAALRMTEMPNSSAVSSLRADLGGATVVPVIALVPNAGKRVDYPGGAVGVWHVDCRGTLQSVLRPDSLLCLRLSGELGRRPS